MRSLILVFLCALPTLATAQSSATVASTGGQGLALGEIGPWGAAALPAGVAPLPSDLWRGADPGTLALAFARIGPDQRFPSMQILARQSVFSGGLAPSTDSDLARLRFEAASRLGPAEATARLIFGVPRLATDASLAALAIDAGLRAGRTQEACALIEAVPVPPQGTTWLEARATCYALNNEPDAANLSIDLAKARGLTDTWLSRAIATAGGPISAPPPFRFDSGRALALSLRTKLKPPLTLAAITDPAAITALVQTADFMASLAPDQGEALIKNGVVRGILPLGLLTNPYASATAVAMQVPPPPPAVAPGTTSPSLPIPQPDVSAPPAVSVFALMAQRIVAAQSLASRAIEARLAVEDLRKLVQSKPTEMSTSDMPLLAEAAVWAGDGALASTIAALSPIPLDPRLSLAIALYDPARQAQAVEARIDAAPSDTISRRLALRDAMVAWSAGMPVGGGVSFLVQAGLPWGTGSNGGLRAALALSAQRGSKGETALLAALATQGVDPVNMDGETLIGVITALRTTGLTDAARDLARDYILANYVTLTPVRAPSRGRTATTLSPAPRPNSPAAQPARAQTTLPPTPTQSSAPRTPTAPVQAKANTAPALTPPATTLAPSLARSPASPQRPSLAATARPAPPRPTASKPSWGTP